MITLRPPFRAKDMEGLFNKVCKGQYSRIPDRFSDDLFKIVQYLLIVNSIQRPSCDQILQHPIIMKRIEYFKSFGSEDENEDKCLLKTIHMPKNLLFLSDKLPKPNYDKQFKDTNKGEEENKNYRSFNKMALINNSLKSSGNNTALNEISKENNSYGTHQKRPVKLIPLNNNLNNNININSIIEREKENILMNKENSKQDLYLALNNKNKNNNNNILSVKNKSTNNSSNNLVINKNINVLPNSNNKISLKKEDLYYINVLSKQKEDLRKLMLKNSNLNRRLNYLNNNSQINVSPIKDLNKIFMPNINNKSAPKKINNYKLIKNKYYIHGPPYLRGYEKYQKSPNKMNYDYGKNYNLNLNNINNLNNLLQHRELLPKVPRRLSPIKKQI
jgi:NIMA (never in mitosis gene a)-related kinase